MALATLNAKVNQASSNVIAVAPRSLNNVGMGKTFKKNILKITYYNCSKKNISFLKLYQVKKLAAVLAISMLVTASLKAL